MIFQNRFRNDADLIVTASEPYRPDLSDIVVESTFNWFWLVDSLQEKAHSVHLANTGAIKTYQGLTCSTDEDDAKHLAHLSRLGILPEG